MPSSAYLWFDAEFTSLDLEAARLLQVAIVATDRRLNRIGEDFVRFVALEDDVEISPWVEENLPEIVAACRTGEAQPLAGVDAALGAWIDETVGGTAENVLDRPVIAGNSVHNDWALARRLLPALIARAHYRLLDVSGLKLLWQDRFDGEEFDKDDPDLLQAHFPGFRTRPGMKPHDAYYDAQASIAELGFYLSRLQKTD